jgi:hypothetical protein
MVRIGFRALILAQLRRLTANRAGNFALFSALTLSVVALGVGGSIDFRSAHVMREKMQQALDAGALAAVRKTSLADQRSEIQKVFLANFTDLKVNFDRDLSVDQNPDGSITATMRASMDTAFLGITGIRQMMLAVRSGAIALKGTTAGPCVTVLGSSGQDVLVNSNANVQASKCNIDVASTANPAFIMNSGSTINFATFCVKGTQYIKNGGNLNNLQTACATHADPYAGTLTEPTVASTCTTSGTMDGATITLQPGVHCATTFNGSPTITFSPGLHIIKGRMIINSGAKVTATGVTFYFPDVNSEIRGNGTFKLTASAPTSGTYKGILMFEKTSNASNNANKVQYIINSAVDSTLEGIIYLPNRNMVLNSASLVTARISMVVNQLLFDAGCAWSIDPYAGAGGTAVATGARLTL